jgi:2-keto-4-pentenoate hydratase/2-oxohepta-3-ene-1,7-dioic acid hydratase in catechol pathway
VRLCRYERDWRGHWGIVEGATVRELVGDPYGACRAGAVVGDLGDLRLLAPCTPETIWSLGANYPSRLAERGFPLPTEPAFAVVPGSCICGTGAEIRVPEHETRREYGAELGIVVRRDCRDVEPAEVDDYVLGYTGLNNIWIKDAGEVTAYARPMRVYDNHCPTGPILTDEVDPDDRRIRLWVDGQPRQDDSTATAVFRVRDLVSWLSKRVTIRRGDLIMTGSPGGIEGHSLQYGQTVEMEVEGIGRLSNPVTRVDAASVSYVVSLAKWLEMRADGVAAAPTSFHGSAR